MKFRKLETESIYKGIIPTKAHENDAGYDLYAPETIVVPGCFNIVSIFKWLILGGKNPFIPTKIQTRISGEIPLHSVGLIQDRSSLGSKGLKVFGGVIDYGYTGDITVCIMNFSCYNHKFKFTDRVAQLVVVPIVKEYQSFTIGNVNKQLVESARGNSGFGSSGK